MLDLFHRLVKPIALYGSDIWGIGFLSCNSAERLWQSMTAQICEKLNLSFCRYVLDIHRTAKSSALRGELGRFPLGIDIVGNITKYHDYMYLLANEEGTIMQEVSKLGNELHAARQYPNQTRLWQRRY